MGVFKGKSPYHFPPDSPLPQQYPDRALRLRLTLRAWLFLGTPPRWTIILLPIHPYSKPGACTGWGLQSLPREQGPFSTPSSSASAKEPVGQGWRPEYQDGVSRASLLCNLRSSPSSWSLGLLCSPSTPWLFFLTLALSLLWAQAEVQSGLLN